MLLSDIDKVNRLCLLLLIQSALYPYVTYIRYVLQEETLSLQLVLL